MDGYRKPGPRNQIPFEPVSSAQLSFWAKICTWCTAVFQTKNMAMETDFLNSLFSKSQILKNIFKKKFKKVNF